MKFLQILNKTNKDAAIIVSELKITVQRINNSSALWALLNDNSIPKDLKASISNIRNATNRAGSTIDNLNSIISDVKKSKGLLGAVLKDTSFAKNLNDAILKIKTVGNDADVLAAEINKVVIGVRQDINTGKGPINTLFKDSTLVIKLNASLDNIQKGTDGFNQNMEALKHNFLLRGYFRKLEKKKEKERLQLLNENKK